MKNIDIPVVIKSREEISEISTNLEKLGFKHSGASLVEHQNLGKLIEHRYYRESDQGETFAYSKIS